MSKRILTVIGLLLAAACAHRGQPDIATLSSNSDQVIWEAGQKALKKKQWESARQHLRRIIDGFPQSEYGPGARLALGKSYLDEGGTANAILAASAYRDFLTLYPSHPQSDHAQFQVGEAFFKQKNGPDRDQTPIQQALEEYQKLLELHPGSAHAEKARGRLRECRESLARSEFMVGEQDQYCIKGLAVFLGRFGRQRTQQATGHVFPGLEGDEAPLGRDVAEASGQRLDDLARRFE